MSRRTVTDELIHAAQDGDADAMWSIVSAYEPALQRIVSTAAGQASRDDREDLMQEARAMLVLRVQDYDTSANAAELSTYVHRAVLGAVMEAYVQMRPGLSVEPWAEIRVRRAMAEAKGDVDAAFTLVNTGKDSRHVMGRSTFLAVVDALQGVESLDAPIPQKDGPTTLADVIPDTSLAPVTDPLERRDLAHWLMTRIAPRQAYTLRAFYGVGMERQPDQDVATHLQVKPGRVRVLRHDGVTSAQRVAVRHGIAA